MARRSGWAEQHPGLWNWPGLIFVGLGSIVVLWFWFVRVRKVSVLEKVELKRTPDYLLTDGPYRYSASFRNFDAAIDAQVCNRQWDLASRLGVQSDGKVIIYGITYASCCDDNGRWPETFLFLNRALANGTRDTGFDETVDANTSVHAVAVQPDGKILVGGYFSVFKGANRNGIARLNANVASQSTMFYRLIAP